MLALAAAGCLLVPAGPVRPPRAEVATPGADHGPAAVDCAGLRGGGPTLAYRNPRWGIAMARPAAFALDPESIPENGDTARFRTADGRAAAVVMALRNGLGQSPADLRREAKWEIVENGRGTVTYERARDDWFVLSGHLAGRVYYRRTFLSRDGRVVATLWIEFPREMRPCLDAAVTTMSLSFREAR